MGNKFKDSKISFYAGILLLGTATLISVYDMGVDHTECECLVTKTLNLIPVADDEIALGTIHQDYAIRSDLHDKGYEEAVVNHIKGLAYDHLEIYADKTYIKSYSIVKRRKK